MQKKIQKLTDNLKFILQKTGTQMINLDKRYCNFQGNPAGRNWHDFYLLTSVNDSGRKAQNLLNTLDFQSSITFFAQMRHVEAIDMFTRMVVGCSGAKMVMGCISSRSNPNSTRRKIRFRRLLEN